ncbi:unnamed protein product, partial [Heterotrigona itama]
MTRNITNLLFVLWVLCIVKQSECYKILAIIATPSYSHQIPYRRLWLELHNRGHEILLVTANPMPNINSPNFTQIDVSQSYKIFRTLNFIEMKLNGDSWLQIIENYGIPITLVCAENVFNNTEFKKVYAPDSDAKFDILLTEYLYVPAIVGLAHRFDVPIIGTCLIYIHGHSYSDGENFTTKKKTSTFERLSSLGLPAWNEHILGGLVLPSHESTWEMENKTGSNLPFLKRLWNFVSFWHFLHLLYTELLLVNQQLAEKYLGPLPPLTDIMKNTSMLFINQAS